MRFNALRSRAPRPARQTNGSRPRVEIHPPRISHARSRTPRRSVAFSSSHLGSHALVVAVSVLSNKWHPTRARPSRETCRPPLAAAIGPSTLSLRAIVPKSSRGAAPARFPARVPSRAASLVPRAKKKGGSADGWDDYDDYDDYGGEDDYDDYGGAGGGYSAPSRDNFSKSGGKAGKKGAAKRSKKTKYDDDELAPIAGDVTRIINDQSRRKPEKGAIGNSLDIGSSLDAGDGEGFESHGRVEG